MRRIHLIGIAAVFTVVAGSAALAGLSSGREPPVTQQPASAARQRLTPQDTDARIAALEARIARSDPNGATLVSLGYLYVQKARESGDPAYYARAESALTRALTLDRDDADALTGLGSLAASRHEFGRALALGERARAIAPAKAGALSVVVDALVELGRYDEAVIAVQQLVDLRPDLGSFARASYLRELYGDLPGAIELMRRAVQAGAPGSESAAWTRVQLGHLLLQSGDLDAARREYARTLADSPGYVHARAGLARLAAVRGDLAAAASEYDQITRVLPLPEYVIALAEVQRAVGQPEAAARSEALVRAIDQLQRAAGVRTDVEMALFEADTGDDPAGTVERARAAVLERPGIHGYDALAWALYRAGRFEEARAASQQALRLGTRDPLLRFHAGMIAAALGDDAGARAELRLATAALPRFSVRYAAEAEATLARLAPRS